VDRPTASAVTPTTALTADREALADALACALYAELRAKHEPTAQTRGGNSRTQETDDDD
jgi:uncharacterized lipoprotein NlpE involved in copper resistance